MPTLKELIEQLPPDLQEEVRDFVEFLLERKVRKTKRKLRLDWAGGLKEYRNKYTSLELQRKVLEWWGLVYLMLTSIEQKKNAKHLNISIFKHQTVDNIISNDHRHSSGQTST